jgi:hypothetical protein
MKLQIVLTSNFLTAGYCMEVTSIVRQQRNIIEVYSSVSITADNIKLLVRGSVTG